MDFTIEQLSEDALLLRFGDRIDASLNARVHAAARALRKAALPGIMDIAPAYASLLVRFDAGFDMGSGSPSPIQELHRILGVASEPGPVLDPVPSTRVVEIPVCYDEICGPDLEGVAAHAGLRPDAVIARHTAVEYTVAMLGFAPGFPYLLGLDPTLHAPRREIPRTRVPAGSVAIGGAQTGVYPRELPGGWQLIGRTPLALFDASREPPCLLAPGDCVRFCAISTGEYDRLRAKDGEPRPVPDPGDHGRSRK